MGLGFWMGGIGKHCGNIYLKYNRFDIFIITKLFKIYFYRFQVTNSYSLHHENCK